MRIILINAEQLVRHYAGEADEVKVVSRTENARKNLFSALHDNPEATLILDSEIRFGEHSKYQDLEGLQLAYELRINPEIRFRGFMKLHGFLPIRALKEHRFGGLLRGGDKIHAREFRLKGVSYVVYPSWDFLEEPPLSESEWREVVCELDEIFVREFGDFEHSFRNIAMFRKMDATSKLEKKNEFESFLRTLLQIERTTAIRPVYIAQMEAIKKGLQRIIAEVCDAEESSVQKDLIRLKSEIAKFKVLLNEGTQGR